MIKIPRTKYSKRLEIQNPIVRNSLEFETYFCSNCVRLFFLPSFPLLSLSLFSTIFIIIFSSLFAFCSHVLFSLFLSLFAFAVFYFLPHQLSLLLSPLTFPPVHTPSHYTEKTKNMISISHTPPGFEDIGIHLQHRKYEIHIVKTMIHPKNSNLQEHDFSVIHSTFIYLHLYAKPPSLSFIPLLVDFRRLPTFTVTCENSYPPHLRPTTSSLTLHHYTTIHKCACTIISGLGAGQVWLSGVGVLCHTRQLLSSGDTDMLSMQVLITISGVGILSVGEVYAAKMPLVYGKS